MIYSTCYRARAPMTAPNANINLNHNNVANVSGSAGGGGSARKAAATSTNSNEANSGARTVVAAILDAGAGTADAVADVVVVPPPAVVAEAVRENPDEIRTVEVSDESAACVRVPSATPVMRLFMGRQDVQRAVRERGWTDALWVDVARLRSEADAVRIFRSFDGEGAQPLRFPGEVLQALMNLVPYPVPANRAQVECVCLKVFHPPYNPSTTPIDGISRY
jgi:hypothetical protein